MNPSGTIPMIIDDNCMVKGSPEIFVNYLCATQKRLNSYLPQEHRSKIDQHMNLFATAFRPRVQRLIKVLVGPQAFGVNQFTGEEVENAKTSFLEDVLQRLNTLLEGKRQFLISANEATAVDILYYNELSIALFLLRLKGFKKNYPNVNAWIKIMSEI